MTAKAVRDGAELALLGDPGILYFCLFVVDLMMTYLRTTSLSSSLSLASVASEYLLLIFWVCFLFSSSDFLDDCPVFGCLLICCLRLYAWDRFECFLAQ